MNADLYVGLTIQIRLERGRRPFALVSLHSVLNVDAITLAIQLSSLFYLPRPLSSDLTSMLQIMTILPVAIPTNDSGVAASKDRALVTRQLITSLT